MTNQHTDRLTTEARSIIDRLIPLNTRRDALHLIAEYPVCGKPGHSFKAARKAARELVTIDAEIGTILREMEAFIHGSSKDSQLKRERRYGYIKSALAEWGA